MDLTRRELSKGLIGLSAFAAQTGVPMSGFAQSLDARSSTDAKSVDGAIRYLKIGRWDVAKLNHILSVQTPAFGQTAVKYTEASNEVDLYRIYYPSVLPELGNRPVILTGLIAVPDKPGKDLNLVSYQHGTVYLKTQVPSFPDQSPETQTMIAQFAGQGYALIGADYVGMGLSNAPQGYLVKESHQQATADLLIAAHAVLRDLGKTPQNLFLSGWSQGGYVTMALLQRLEQSGVAVRAATTACAPTDLLLAISSPLLYPRANDANWIGTVYILMAFSYENFYGVPGLARSLLRPAIYDMAQRAYNNEPFDPSTLLLKLTDMINDAYFDPDFLAKSSLGRLAKANDVYRWAIRTPTRNYYGDSDEAVRPLLAQLPMQYQNALGGDTVHAVRTGNDTHRGTFVRAVPEWKIWFDSLIK